MNNKKCGILPIVKSITQFNKLWEFKNGNYRNIPIIKKYKYLGVTLDYQFTLKDNLQTLREKVLRRTGQLKRYVGKLDINIVIIIW